MKFKNLNEKENLKKGDLFTVEIGYEFRCGEVLSDASEGGYIATLVKDSKELPHLAWIDDNGYVFGDYKIKKFNGNRKQFMETWQNLKY